MMSAKNFHCISTLSDFQHTPSLVSRNFSIIIRPGNSHNNSIYHGAREKRKNICLALPFLISRYNLLISTVRHHIKLGENRSARILFHRGSLSLIMIMSVQWNMLPCAFDANLIINYTKVIIIGKLNFHVPGRDKREGSREAQTIPTG
jgi:hypothetical protein